MSLYEAAETSRVHNGAVSSMQAGKGNHEPVSMLVSIMLPPRFASSAVVCRLHKVQCPGIQGVARLLPSGRSPKSKTA